MNKIIKCHCEEQDPSPVIARLTKSGEAISKRARDRLRNLKEIASGFAIAMTVFSVFVFFSGCAKQEIKNTGSTGKNIICFGTSITFGYGVNPEESYPIALSKLTKIPVLNRGIDGNTSVEGLRRIKEDVLNQAPVLVIIEFGANDFLKKIPMEETINNVEKMIDLAQSSGAMAAVADISAGLFFRDYRVKLNELARRKGAIFIPSLLNGIITNPNLKSDFLHPNVSGYKIVAQRVYQAIGPYLNDKI